MSGDKFMLGYDYQWLSEHGEKLPVSAPIGSTIVVGGSGSGKSTSVLYWLWKMVKSNDVELTIVDFKASHELAGIAVPERFAEAENSYSMIKSFYVDTFLSIPEGGDGRTHILLIDEAAGLLTHLSMSKEGKMVKAAYLAKRIKETPLLKKMWNEYHWGRSGTGKTYVVLWFVLFCRRSERAKRVLVPSCIFAISRTAQTRNCIIAIFFRSGPI